MTTQQETVVAAWLHLQDRLATVDRTPCRQADSTAWLSDDPTEQTAAAADCQTCPRHHGVPRLRTHRPGALGRLGRCHTHRAPAAHGHRPPGERMTHDPDQTLHCVTTELDLLDAVAQRQASVQLLLEEAGRELTAAEPHHEAVHADLGDALVLLKAAARDLARAYAAARGHVYDLPARRDAR